MLLPAVSIPDRSRELVCLHKAGRTAADRSASQETILKHIEAVEKPSTSSSGLAKVKEWSDGIPPALLAQIPESEQRRQTCVLTDD